MLRSATLGALACALAAERRDGRTRRRAIAVFVIAVLSLHLTGMAGLRTTPLGPAGADITGEAFGAMVLAIARAGLIVITSGAVALLKDRAAQRARAQELSLPVSTDALTGLANRAAFHERLDAPLDAAWDARGLLAVIAIDLDGFIRPNDASGHAAGDMALIPSALWNDLLRPLDIREGADASCLGDEAVPGGAAGVHDGLLAGEQPPRQIAIP
jgi:predicted signal transduction protein with EAL and GGDEF domain